MRNPTTDTGAMSEGVVYQNRSRRSCDEAGVMLEAVGISSEVLPWEGSFLLIVQTKDVAKAEEQLHLYSLENRKKIRHKIPVTAIAKGLPGALLYVAVLLLVYGYQHNGAFDVDLINFGSANAGLIQQGEWWRSVTALTLHSGFRHLIGNICFGVLFGLFVSQHLGSGLAWFSILMAGAMGNIISAYIQTSGHTSIGASTAVFAALGIQAAYTWRTSNNLSFQGIRRWTPIIGGIVLLSFLGGTGERVDVASHITGFLSGILFGSVLGAPGKRLITEKRHQIMLGVAAILIIALAWLIAVNQAI